MKTTSTTLTPQQINEIRALLFDSEPQEEILLIGDVMIDAEDLATLAAERYPYNNIIKRVFIVITTIVCKPFKKLLQQKLGSITSEIWARRL